MKKLFLNPVIFLLLTIFFFSCQKSNPEIKGQPEAELAKSSLIKVDNQKLLSLLHNPSNISNVIGNENFLEYLSENLDTLGAWHNEFLDYIFVRTVDNQLSMCNKIEYKSYNDWSTEFFQTKGIEFNGDFVDYYVANELETQVIYPRAELSEEANSILATLQSYIDESDSVELDEFITNCENLKAFTLQSLESDNEKVAVGGAISIAKYSAQYWEKNFIAWRDYYTAMPCSPNYAAKLSPTEKAVLQADTKGAIGGAVSGIGGGPLGMIAGGLVGGGFSSCVSAVCIGFGITHITDWLW